MLTFFYLVFCSTLHLGSSRNKTYEGYKMFRLMPSSDQVPKVRMLQNMDGIDTWSQYHSDYVDVMVSPDQYEKFQTFVSSGKIDSKLQIEDVQKLLEKEQREQRKMARRYRSGISFAYFHRFAKINSYLDDMARKYKEIAKTEVIGRSTEGRVMKIIKISEDLTCNSPVILIDGGIHAREWISPAMVLYVINQLIENSSNSDLLSSLEWHLLPVVNPDGYEYSHTHDRMWRKTRSRVSNACYGVDGNRNFDFHWNEIGTGPNPCGDTYAGPKPFSEPETRALRDYALRLKGRIKLYISFHSYGNFILHPWGYTKRPADDAKEMTALGLAVNNAHVKAGGESYTVGSAAGVLYAAAGGSDDWMKAKAGVQFSYTVELTNTETGFVLPTKLIKPTVTNFFEAVREFVNKIRNM